MSREADIERRHARAWHALSRLPPDGRSALWRFALAGAMDDDTPVSGREGLAEIARALDEIKFDRIPPQLSDFAFELLLAIGRSLNSPDSTRNQRLGWP